MGDIPRIKILSALMLAGLATVGCATAGDGSTDAEAVAADRDSNAAVEAMPAQLDAVARVPLDEFGEMLVNALYDEKLFDPHHSPYSPPDGEFSADDLEQVFSQETGGDDRQEHITIAEGVYACPHHSDVILHSESGECQKCGEELMTGAEFEAQDQVEDEEAQEETVGQYFTIDDEDWIDWPDSMPELGSRLALSTLIQGIPQRRPIRGLRSYGFNYHNYPLPPLEPEGVTGPAWIGYTVDDRTRRFFDYAEPPRPGDTGDDRWIPRVHATIAIPMDGADDHVAKYELFCLDESHRVCNSMTDVRAEEGLLIIERVGGLDDEDLNTIGADDHVDTDADGLVERFGHDAPSAALATFLHEDGPGHYARVDGLRRMATAEYLAAKYDADQNADDQLEVMARALRTRLYGDVAPRHDDLATLASATDEGLTIDTVASRTEAADDATSGDRLVPATVFDGESEAVATWRIDASRQTAADLADGSAWQLTGDELADHLEWFQGAMMAAVDRPFAFESLTFDEDAGLPPELERALPDAVVEFVEVTGESEAVGDVASLLEDGGLHSAAVHIVDRPAAYRFERDHGLAVEFHFRDTDVAQRLGAAVDAVMEGGDFEWAVETDVVDIDEWITLRVGIDVSVDEFGDDLDYGPPGGEFHWAGLAGESRENLDRRFTSAFYGVFPPEFIRWQPMDRDSLSQTAIQFGSDTLESPLKPPVTDAARPATDGAALCIGAVQADIASLFDTEVYHTERTVDLDPVLDGLRDCADDHPDGADAFEAAADNWQIWNDELRR